ncbi:hypothetical protein ACQP04_35445 [Pseudonocardia halophobica]|uniref:hypothetical protein n=1 Tax=Pseudonocardia halophobica TaxID=29401 RepID=UPI003D8F2028
MVRHSLIYALICAVSIISRGFAGLGSDAAHTMFAFAANPVVGLSVGTREQALQAAFVHLVYNFAIVVIYVIPLLRPVPLFCAQKLARVASEHRWVLAVYLLTVFIVLPALVIIVVGVL